MCIVFIRLLYSPNRKVSKGRVVCPLNRITGLNTIAWNDSAQLSIEVVTRLLWRFNLLNMTLAVSAGLISYQCMSPTSLTMTSAPALTFKTNSTGLLHVVRHKQVFYQLFRKCCGDYQLCCNVIHLGIVVRKKNQLAWLSGMIFEHC